MRAAEHEVELAAAAIVPELLVVLLFPFSVLEETVRVARDAVEVEKVLPNYKAQVKWLKDEGGNITRMNKLNG